MNPNPDGLIPDADFQRYTEFGNEIRKRFDRPLAWTRGKGTTVELKLKNPASINHVAIMEDIRFGERIRSYRVEGLVGSNHWQTLCKRTSVGHKRIQQFESVNLTKVRINVLSSVAQPLISQLAVYSVS